MNLLKLPSSVCQQSPHKVRVVGTAKWRSRWLGFNVVVDIFVNEDHEIEMLRHD